MKLRLKRVEEPYVLEVKNENGLKIMVDAAPEIGGKNSGLRPMELLASSLAGCMSIDILSILAKKRQNIKHFQINIQAERRDSVPAAFKSFNFEFEVDQEVSIEKLEQAIELSHAKYCSVWASLDKSIAFTHTIKLI